MLLTKTRPDEWISGHQFISHFSLPVIWQVGKHTLESEQFGLGWTARCVVLNQVIGAKTNTRRLQTCSTPTPLGIVSFSTSIGSAPQQSSLVVKIMVTLPNEVALNVAVPSVILPDVAFPDISLPDMAPPDVVSLDVLPPDVTLSDMDHPEDIPADVDSLEVTPSDIDPPEEPLPQISQPDPALTYWSRMLKVMKSTLDNDGKLPIDLKFMVCTRISPRGRIGFPKAIFASSVLVEGYTAYLDKYIKTGAPLVDLDFDGHKDTEWDVYDYDGDSDFDEDDGDDDNNADTEDLDVVISCSAQTDVPTIDSHLRMDFDFEAFEHDRRRGNVQGPVRLGTICHVKDTAYTTWKTFLVYLYTQEISFAPLKSSKILPTVTNKDACSPKSMYRLAVRVGLDSLKDLAFENIRSQLTPSNIVDEVFSEHTHRYPELLDVEVRYLVANFTDPVVYPRWERKMEEVGRGLCPQGTSVVNRVLRLTLMEREISDENSQTHTHTRQWSSGLECHLNSLHNVPQGLPDAYIHALAQLLGKSDLKYRLNVLHNLLQELSDAYIHALGQLLRFHLVPMHTLALVTLEVSTGRWDLSDAYIHTLSRLLTMFRLIPMHCPQMPYFPISHVSPGHFDLQLAHSGTNLVIQWRLLVTQRTARFMPASESVPTHYCDAGNTIKTFLDTLRSDWIFYAILWIEIHY
ncbi:hypothetical protein EDD18DRAFT_1434025 [Armillaria luteobubalina]|uniref:BTB domain-containing protein n=1 Tax=Armillaria luteobubalina TaxID=153913 RepID=A0AA39UCV2_9AGAR|nr:hypothetical protein EDD18DRAFT_1434025 [Armillaria luteobubalina]